MRAENDDVLALTSTAIILIDCFAASGCQKSGEMKCFFVFIASTVTEWPSCIKPWLRRKLAIDPPSLGGRGTLLLSCRIFMLAFCNFFEKSQNLIDEDVI